MLGKTDVAYTPPVQITVQFFIQLSAQIHCTVKLIVCGGTLNTYTYVIIAEGTGKCGVSDKYKTLSCRSPLSRLPKTIRFDGIPYRNAVSA